MRKSFAFAVLASLAGCSASAQSGSADAAAIAGAPSVETVGALELEERIMAGEVRLIDVRTPEEFAEGHIAGAINLPVDEFDPETLPEADGKETILYCRTGRRSARAATMLAEFRDGAATHLEGGIVAWEEAGLPVTKPE